MEEIVKELKSIKTDLGMQVMRYGLRAGKNANKEVLNGFSEAIKCIEIAINKLEGKENVSENV